MRHFSTAPKNKCEQWYAFGGKLGKINCTIPEQYGENCLSDNEVYGTTDALKMTVQPSTSNNSDNIQEYKRIFLSNVKVK